MFVLKDLNMCQVCTTALTLTQWFSNFYMYMNHHRPILSNKVATIHMAMDHLKVKVRCALSVKYIPDFND